MLIRDFHYLEQNGYHFPDTPMGSTRRYAIDFNCWFQSELITAPVTVEWKCVNHLSWVDDTFFSSEEVDTTSNLAIVTITPPCRGTYRVECIITAESNGMELVKVVPMSLKIY